MPVVEIGEFKEEFPASIRVVGVKIRNRGEVRRLAAGEAALKAGDYVLVETEDDLAYGVVHEPPQRLPFIPPMRVMKPILRPADEHDLRRIREHERVARDGLAYCRERAQALGLQMKLVEVYRSFTRRETRFVYTSEERVDFRQLVRDLARRFGGRIEMRHIGPREEAQRLGGVDSCGLVLCCASFLTDLRPIKIKQARAHGMPMEESRLLGVCGRLKCCLLFEALDAANDAEGKRRPAPLINPAPPGGPGRSRARA